MIDTVPVIVPPSEAPVPEQRAEPRHPSGQLAFIRYRPELDATYQLVTIWNVSTQGIGLFLSRPLDAGTACHLQFRHLAVRDRIATVVNSSPKMGGWLIGCTLDKPFRDSELRALRI
jgi:hypothetical protein